MCALSLSRQENTYLSNQKAKCVSILFTTSTPKKEHEFSVLHVDITIVYLTFVGYYGHRVFACKNAITVDLLAVGCVNKRKKQKKNLVQGRCARKERRTEKG